MAYLKLRMESQSIAPNRVKSTNRHDYSVYSPRTPRLSFKAMENLGFIHYIQLHNVHNIIKQLNDVIFQKIEVVVKKNIDKL